MQTTFSYYQNTFHGEAIIDKKQFNKWASENETYIVDLLNDGLLVARGDEALEKAVCALCEIDNSDSKILSGDNVVATSETIGSYSRALDTSLYQASVKANTKSTARKKLDTLNTYYKIARGVK